MFSVYKYMLEPTTTQTVQMPADAAILKVDFQDGIACLWALVCIDDGHPVESRTFMILGTGRLMEDDEAYRAEYIGTLHANDEFGRNLVNHVFELVGS